MRSEMLSLLADFVAIESYSGVEQPAITFIGDVFARSGLAVNHLPMAHLGRRSSDLRTNIVGRHTPTRDSGRSLLFNGHVDIVPVGPLALWDSPPSRPWSATARSSGGAPRT